MDVIAFWQTSSFCIVYKIYINMSSSIENSANVLEMAKNLYERRPETGDVTFAVGSEKCQIRAHRYILAALSDRYKAQFYGAMPENGVITVTDVSPAAFEEFLHFFYMDEVTLTIDNIEDVINLAKQSLADNLVKQCAMFLVKVITKSMLPWCYRLALRYEIERLEEICVYQIRSHIKEIFQTAEILNCEEGELCQILALGGFNCNVNDVFEACISWAQTRCQQNGIDNANGQQLRATLGFAFDYIQFREMTVHQFAMIGHTYAELHELHERVKIPPQDQQQTET